jgi:chromosome segregation ATPase
MTVLGKILAVLNLVLSLAIAAFIVTTYVSRTNWHIAFLKTQEEAKLAKTDAETHRQKAEEARGKLLEAQKDYDAKLAVVRKDVDAAKGEVAAERVKFEAERRKNGVLQENQVSAQAELQRRADEVNYLKGQLTKRDNELTAKETKLQGALNDAVAATIAANSEHERNTNLLKQVADLGKALQDAQRAKTTVVGAPSTRKNPPDADIEGLVKATDPESGYVTISIGSDAGVNKGNTLEVYRLKPDAAYLGTIEILAVRPNEAVGKPIVRPRGVIRVGDTVASYIVSKR